MILNLSEKSLVETRLARPDANTFRLLIAMSVLCFLIVATVVGKLWKQCVFVFLCVF